MTILTSSLNTFISKELNAEFFTAGQMGPPMGCQTPTNAALCGS